jgi:hypothetical protein
VPSTVWVMVRVHPPAGNQFSSFCTWNDQRWLASGRCLAFPIFLFPPARSFSEAVQPLRASWFRSRLGG